MCCDQTRGNSPKLKEGMFRLDITKTFFMVRVVSHWHRLPRKGVDATSSVSEQPGSVEACPWQGSQNKRIFTGHFEPKHSVVLCSGL